MTLKEAIEVCDSIQTHCELFVSGWAAEGATEGDKVYDGMHRKAEALRLVIEAAKQQADDTVEIVTLTESRS